QARASTHAPAGLFRGRDQIDRRRPEKPRIASRAASSAMRGLPGGCPPKYQRSSSNRTKAAPISAAASIRPARPGPGQFQAGATPSTASVIGPFHKPQEAAQFVLIFGVKGASGLGYFALRGGSAYPRGPYRAVMYDLDHWRTPSWGLRRGRNPSRI